jgi:acyl-CoA reductase-like NAD-dependent aldehyde dehydrogenase
MPSRNAQRWSPAANAPPLRGGSFFQPTVLTDVTTDMVITKEETSGPGCPALPLHE